MDQPWRYNGGTRGAREGSRDSGEALVATMALLAALGQLCGRWLGHNASSGGAGNCGRRTKLAETVYGRGRLQLRRRGKAGAVARARLARRLGEVAEAAMSAE